MGAFDPLATHDFQRLAHFIEDYSGIRMPAIKQTMVEGRLRRRVRALGVDGLDAYCRYVFEEGGLGQEAVHLIDAVTTNKTEFFREPEHFRFLTDVALPEAMAAHRGPFQVWSAASSIGAEPYTIAMVLDACAQRLPDLRFEITATDICTEALATAVRGIYPEDMADAIPADLARRYVMRARQPDRGEVRIVPELRRQVRFRRLNLMDRRYPVARHLDVVFCRNILIYFDKPTQQAVLERLAEHLRPGGYLILGHSESLTGLDLSVRPVAPTVFQRG